MESHVQEQDTTRPRWRVQARLPVCEYGINYLVLLLIGVVSTNPRISPSHADPQAGLEGSVGSSDASERGMLTIFSNEQVVFKS